MYAHSDTLLLANVFKNFRNMCRQIYELDPTNFFLHQISMTSSLKKDQIKIRSFNRYGYVFDGRKMYQMWNMSCYSSINKI